MFKIYYLGMEYNLMLSRDSNSSAMILKCIFSGKSLSLRLFVDNIYFFQSSFPIYYGKLVHVFNLICTEFHYLETLGILV